MAPRRPIKTVWGALESTHRVGQTGSLFAGIGQKNDIEGCLEDIWMFDYMKMF
jgi:hypothetical protein